MHPLGERVLSHIRRQELLRAGDRVGVAVSGGIDSVALLRLLLELRSEFGIVLSVVHFNHKLRRAESDGDEQFVGNLAREHGLEFYSDSEDVAQHAVEERVSVEAAARELRYGFFRSLLGESPSGAKAQSHSEAPDRSAESAAPAKSEFPIQSKPQGLKPDPEVAADGAAGSRALSRHVQAAQAKVPTLSQKTREGWGTQIPHLDKIATGHTLDDQAETVLMRMIRGSGLRGLGGIYPRIPVEEEEGEICGEIVRPLLLVRRRDLEQYLEDIGQSWREDSSNSDAALTRNRVRKLVVPLLEGEFNPAVVENLAELAEIARGEEDYWENEIAGWMGTTVHWSEPEWVPEALNDGLVQIAGLNSPGGQELQSRIDNAAWLVRNARVSLLWFLGEPTAVQRRLVKAIGERAGIPLEFKHVEEILRFAAEDGGSGRELSLPLGWKVRREPDEIVFQTPDLRAPAGEQNYEYELPIPGTIVVNEMGLQIEARRVPAEAAAGYNPEQLLDAASLPGPLRVRNWRPGDRFWPAHTKSPKKIKELLQERHVAQPERKLWPVVQSGDEIVWVRGFPSPARLRAKPGREAILIAEKPLFERPAT
ncbi:MAG: tRNA lysidine(34) synthetase TilS [Candidatus Sulfotelmatobacter sp.]